jgi:hypothetical protein
MHTHTHRDVILYHSLLRCPGQRVPQTLSAFCFCLSIVCPSVCLSRFICVHSSVCLPVCLSVCLVDDAASHCLPHRVTLPRPKGTASSVCLPVFLYLSVCLSICLSFCLSMPVCPRVSLCLLACPPALSVYLLVCLSACLSISLSNTLSTYIPDCMIAPCSACVSACNCPLIPSSPPSPPLPILPRWWL